jgi:hypothetical protein
MEGKRRGNGLRLRLGRKGIDGLLGSFAPSLLLISSDFLLPSLAE